MAGRALWGWSFPSPVVISTSAASAHIPPTDAPRRLGLSQPGVAPGAPVPVYIDPTASFPSCPPSGKPQFRN